MAARITDGGNICENPAYTNLHQVYTCQQAQPKRCNFFLWDDEAKPREAAAVLSNSRTEPIHAPHTPTKPSYAISSCGLQTPYTDTGKGRQDLTSSSPYTPSKSSSPPQPAVDTQTTSTTLSTSEEEFYDWPASEDEDVIKVLDQASLPNHMPPPETPNKAVKRDALSTPGKRRFAEMVHGEGPSWPNPSNAGDDVFGTPTMGLRKDGLFTSGYTLPSPADTPTPQRFHDMVQTGQDSELTSEVSRVLQENKVSISSDVKAELKGICDKHSLATRGIMKGRDISRALVNTKNEKISELQETIAALQAERETSRAVIRHLRRDIELAKNQGK
ncbi:MAG: hypothetical protein Q9181_005888 [Wetmoreana brouardii]